MKRLGLLLYIGSALAGLSLAQGRRPDSVAERLVVQHRSGADRSAVSRALAANGAKLDKEVAQLRLSVIRVPEALLDKVQKTLEQSGLFNFVERDYLAKGAIVPNDPSYPSQWHLPKVQAPSAWDLTTGSSTAPIAIIDSGIDSTHPDLAARVAPGWSFVTGTSITSDVLGHGTAVAGTAAAISDNSSGVSGLNWRNPILPLVVLDSSDYASYSNIASAITYAADRGARVISISIVGSTASSTLQSAVDYAWNKGSVVFAAAGNNATSAPMYPAACDKVVAVSATDGNDALASFSSFGSWVDVSAPGTMILTTTNGGGYGYWQGTSFSAPLTAAAAALVLAARPSLSNTDLVNLLEQNTDDLGAPGFDPSFGWGRINAYKAVLAAINLPTSDTTPPSAAISSPGSGVSVSGVVSVQGTATDNVGVTRIELYVDGQLTASTTSSPFLFTWNSSSVANGGHTLQVKAYDAANNVGSASRSITVANGTMGDAVPPTATITSPANGSLVNGQVKISVSAFDNVAVSQVSIYIDGILMYTGSAAPYSYTWNSRKATAGNHTLDAKAWDAAGNVGSAARLTISR